MSIEMRARTVVPSGVHSWWYGVHVRAVPCLGALTYDLPQINVRQVRRSAVVPTKFVHLPVSSLVAVSLFAVRLFLARIRPP